MIFSPLSARAKLKQDRENTDDEDRSQNKTPDLTKD